ncbi:MAG: hypothetical protein IH840_14600 [Candidatus Heimdallarchaeota archaeon]|nr:hypothetical protein [Candidatus Heimdallarchaeota archaeon]
MANREIIAFESFLDRPDADRITLSHLAEFLEGDPDKIYAWYIHLRSTNKNHNTSEIFTIIFKALEMEIEGVQISSSRPKFGFICNIRITHEKYKEVTQGY